MRTRRHVDTQTRFYCCNNMKISRQLQSFLYAPNNTVPKSQAKSKVTKWGSITLFTGQSVKASKLLLYRKTPDTTQRPFSFKRSKGWRIHGRLLIRIQTCIQRCWCATLFRTIEPFFPKGPLWLCEHFQVRFTVATVPYGTVISQYCKVFGVR